MGAIRSLSHSSGANGKLPAKDPVRPFHELQTPAGNQDRKNLVVGLPHRARMGRFVFMAGFLQCQMDHPEQELQRVDALWWSRHRDECMGGEWRDPLLCATKWIV